MNELPVTVTLWRTFSRGRRDKHTWRSFVDTFVRDPEVVRDKRRVAGFSLASFSENKRAIARVEHTCGLVLDLDYGTPTVETVKRAFAKTMGVVYTTYSHEPHAPKLRAIFPYTRPLTAVDEHDRIWLWAERKCMRVGLAIDPSARDASHLFFLPSHRPGAQYEFTELEGWPIDVDQAFEEPWLKELSKEELRPITPPSNAVPGKPRKRQGTALGGGDLSASGQDWRLVLRLMREGRTDEEILEELRRVSVKYLKKGESYLTYTIERARGTHEAYAPVMGVSEAALRCLPPRFAKPERRHVDLKLVSDDGELAHAQIIIPAAWHSGAAVVTWRACFPDVAPEALLGRWEDTQEAWGRLRWRDRRFEVAVRDGEVRWIRAAGKRLG